MDKKIKVILVVLIVLLITAVGGLGYYCYNLNQKLNKVTEKNNDAEKETEKLEEPENENAIKYTLFDEEVKLNDICTEQTGICNKTIGDFTLNDKNYSMSINYDMEETGEESYLTVDNTKIIINGYLKRIVKLGENYLTIETARDNDYYNLYIYDEELNLVKSYTDAGSEFVLKDNQIQYYKHSFAIVEDEDLEDIPNYKELHTISINNGNFSEQITKENLEN